MGGGESSGCFDAHASTRSLLSKAKKGLGCALVQALPDTKRGSILVGALSRQGNLQAGRHLCSWADP